MKTYRYLSIVALSLMGAMMIGCSKSDIDESDQSASNDNIVTLTTTVGFDEGDEATKALTSGGVKTFAAGDQIAVVYTNKSNSTAKVISNALTSEKIASHRRSAGFTLSLTNPKESGSVKYIYPASMANSDGSINYDALYSTQHGTLDSLASYFDLAVYEGTMTENAELPSGVCTLSNQLAILAITLKDKNGSNEITSSITGMTITDGTYTYTVTRTAAAGPIYVAIRPTSSASITVTASDGTKNYTKSLTSKSYASGKLYNVSWRMTEASTGITGSINSVICTDGSTYSSVAEAKNAGKTAVAKIVYLGSDTGHDTYKNGLALALSDISSRTWSKAKSACTARNKNSNYAVSGAYWMLPSKDQWDTMINAAGGFIILRSSFSSVGGKNLQQTTYWSSTQYNIDNRKAWTFLFSMGGWSGITKTLSKDTRACLVF